jgi:hypothetical protein
MSIDWRGLPRETSGPKSLQIDFFLRTTAVTAR